MTADAVGGVWRYAMDLGEALVSRGIRVTVATMGPLPNAWQAAEAERRGLGVISRAFRLEWMPDSWDDVERAGEWLLTLERLIAPDVVHLNGYCHAALPWRTPPLVVAHSCVLSWWRAVKGVSAPQEWNIYRERVSRGLRAAGLVIAPSAAMLRALETEYGPCWQAMVIPNALAGQPLQSVGPKENAILSAGRIWDEGKNILAVCEIADGIEWPVWIAGDAGNDRRAREVCAAQYLGWLGPEALVGRYQRAAIYALPARYEPFGLSVLEAARARCALVLGDIPSLRENWEGAALFVPPDNREALRHALTRLIEEPSLREDLAGRAWTRACAFGMDSTADAYLDAYRALEPTPSISGVNS
jgi:glycosyltransferase involved in cell wall biosynthesis